MTPQARTTDPQTSKRRFTVERQTIDDAILDALECYGALTSHALADVTGFSLVSISPAIKPLRVAGRVVATGRRHNRRNLWRLVQPGEIIDPQLHLDLEVE